MPGTAFHRKTGRSRLPGCGRPATVRRMGRPEDFIRLLERAERIDPRAQALFECLCEFLPCAAEHFGAAFASVLLLDPETKELRFEFGMDAPLDELRKVRLRLGEGIAGWVALGRRISRIEDVGPVPMHSKKVDRITGHATRSLLAVPMIHRDEVVGVFEVGNRLTPPGHFTPEDAAEARALAALLAGWAAADSGPATGRGPARTQPGRRTLPEGPLFVGTHASIRQTLDLILRVAPTDDPVLVLGESGTGKELVARRLHHSSRRAQGPLVVLNCAALSETLLESNLFGHVKGAFTDAREDRPGAFVQADGGTLFLDEVGEMSPSCQAKLLRVLEYGEVTPVGGSQPRRVSVRLVAATNRDLAREVEEQRFRLDLYYRLRGIEILVPPLRERSDDIPVLAEFFLRRAAESKEKAVSGFAPEVLDLFCRAPWPGNVRELRHTVEAMVTMSNGETLTVDDIPVSMRRSLEASAPPHQSSLPGGDDHADSAERAEIVKVLQRTCYPATGRWNIARAARELGMSRKTLEYKIKKVYALPAP